MNWLFDNPLVNLPGSSFLFLYAAVITTALIVYGVVKSRLDWTAKMPLPPIPANPDTYEIAYLRGGANEVARSVIFALTQKGFLEVYNQTDGGWVRRTSITPERSQVNHLEKTVYDWFSAPRPTKEVFAKNGLSAVLKTFCTTYEGRLSNQQLLITDEMKAKLSRWTMPFVLTIFGFGGYKLLVAILRGHTNIAFLIIMGIVGLFILAAMSKMPRLSKLGKAYLERLQLAFDRLKTQIQTPAPQAAVAGTNFNGVDPLLLSVGLFGVGILAGTQFSEYEKAFHRANAVSGSSCGSGCGSSCSSGSDGGSSSGDGGGSSCSSGCGGGCGGCS